MTRRPHVVIVGGGVVGLTTAYELVRRQIDVTVVDPAENEPASKGNAGILALSYAVPLSNPQAVMAGVRGLVDTEGAIGFDTIPSLATTRWLGAFLWASRPGRAQRAARDVQQLANRSVRLYEELGERENVDLAMRSTGWLYVARTAAGLREQARSAQGLQRLGIRHEVLGADAVGDVPNLSKEAVGAVRYIDDISFDPRALTQTLNAVTRRAGVNHVHAVVVGPSGEGSSITGVELHDGTTIQADLVILAVGAWSRGLSKAFQCAVDVEPAHGWNLTWNLPHAHPEPALMSIEDHVVVNAMPGAMRVTGGMRFGGELNGPPAEQDLAALRSAAERLVPSIADLPEPSSTWRGARPMTASGLPITERRREKLIVNTGHGTLGMTMAPATAELCASLVADALRGQGFTTTK